jgi:hypothetical protein
MDNAESCGNNVSRAPLPVGEERVELEEKKALTAKSKRKIKIAFGKTIFYSR